MRKVLVVWSCAESGWKSTENSYMDLVEGKKKEEYRGPVMIERD